MMASSALYPYHVLSNQGGASQISMWQFPRSHYKALLSSNSTNSYEKPSSSSSEDSDKSESSEFQLGKPNTSAAFPVLPSPWCTYNSSLVHKNAENFVSVPHSAGTFSRKSEILMLGGSDISPVKVLPKTPLHSAGTSSRNSEILVPSGSDSAPVKVLPKTILCCVCRENVEKTSFSHHLLFGPVKCLNCSITCSSCYSFQSLADGGDGGCRHTFIYPSDPCEFLLFQNSNIFLHGKKESEPSGKISVENYVRMLKTSCISDKPPWRRAIKALKKHIKSVSKSKSSVANTSESSQQSRTNKMVSSEIASTVAHSEKVNEHILSQNYDLEALDQATEYRYIDLAPVAKSMIQPTQQSKFMDKVASANKSDSLTVVAANRLPALQKSGSPKKVEDKRIGPDSSQNPSSDEVQPSQESDSRKNIEKRKKSDAESLVDIPSDGYYLVLTKAIEECPMCYTIICPSRFRINVVSFLVTTVCIECGLTIYFAVSPNVSILTENATVSKKRVGRPPKKKGRKSKVPAEAVKAKAFFAK